MIRVLVITNSYYPDRGGLQELVRQFRNGMVSRGIRCDVLANVKARNMRFTANKAGYILRMPLSKPRTNQTMSNVINLIQKYLIKFLVSFFEYDYIFVHFPDHINRFYGMDIWSKYNMHVVLHGDDVLRWKRSTVNSGFKEFKNFLGNAKSVITVSDYLLQEAKLILGSENYAYRVINNGVTFSNQDNNCSVRNFGKGRTQFSILFVGRLVFDKGADVLIDSLRYLRDLDIMLYIVGEGVEKDELISQVEQSGLENFVSFLGGKDRSLVLSMMMASNAVVIPSRRETFGLVLLEAMAHGSKVVCSSAGGMKSLFREEFGIQINNLEALELADAIRHVLLFREEPDDLSVQDLRTCFSSKEMIDNYLS